MSDLTITDVYNALDAAEAAVRKRSPKYEYAAICGHLRGSIIAACCFDDNFKRLIIDALKVGEQP